VYDPVMPENDAERSRILVEAAAAGDAAAVDALLAQHLPGLRAYVRLRAGPMLRARESASDLVQSVCRDVLENIDRFRYPGESAFKAWLFATAMRKIADRAEYWNAGKRDVAKEVLALDAPVGGESGQDAQLADVYRSVCSPSRVAMGREVMERLEGAFEKLPEDYREVVVLARIVGLSRAEIAEKMGRSEASVRNLLSRALAELAGHLADADAGPASGARRGSDI
jgi:RNA polymerase sigma-70 factor, ECF subfamily